MDTITEPLQYEFMRHALIAATLVGGLCGLIGVYVVLRRMSYIGHGMSHAVFGGAVVVVPLDVRQRRLLRFCHGVEHMGEQVEVLEHDADAIRDGRRLGEHSGADVDGDALERERRVRNATRGQGGGEALQLLCLFERGTTGEEAVAGENDVNESRRR